MTQTNRTRWVHDPKPESKPDELPLLYAEVFGSPAGQRVLDDLGRQAAIPRVDLDDPDPNKGLMQIARHNLVAYIYAKLNAAKR